MSEWVKCSDRLPPFSYVESDNEDDPYEAYIILIFCLYGTGSGYIHDAWLEKDDIGVLKWYSYAPGENGGITELINCNITHWMELPNPPVIHESKYNPI